MIPKDRLKTTKPNDLLHKQYINKLKCCEFKGKQASKIESTSLCCRSYSVLHVIAQKKVVSLCRIEGLWSDCHAPVPLKCL